MVGTQPALRPTSVSGRRTLAVTSHVSTIFHLTPATAAVGQEELQYIRIDCWADAGPAVLPNRIHTAKSRARGRGLRDCTRMEVDQSSLSCLTVKVCPAIVNVPVRLSSFPSFFSTLNSTDPLPVPLAPDLTVIQFALLRAVHAQPVPADTLTVPFPSSRPWRRLSD